MKYLTAVVMVGSLVSTSAFAMGKKPATTTDPAVGGSCSVGVDKTPRPVRSVVLKAVGTKLFPLPNGQQVDLTNELNTMLMTSVTGTATLQPAEAAAGTPTDCDRHIELRAAVTTLEMDVLELGLTIGYSPAGSYPVGVANGATGNLNVKVGAIGMDFSVWECNGNQCAAVASSNADQSTAHVNLNFQANFNAITGSGSLVYNTQLGNVLRAIMVKGVTDLANSDRINELPWHATVRDYSDNGTVIFDAGANARLASGQTFTVYAATASSGACDVFKPLAYVHATSVDAVSSTAVIDQVVDSTKIQAGDVVMIRKAAQ